MPLNVSSIVGSAVSSAGSALAGLAAASGIAANLASALNNLVDPSKLISAARSKNLPAGGIASVAAASAGATFSGVNDDWRVQLSLPTISEYTDSPILKPLKAAGGLVFPYTPSMRISSSASYEDTAITHQNYQFISYQNSKVDSINITGAFNVEDAVQASYWLAVVHYLRSITKMFTGSDAIAGNPPPIVYLNGYGEYVFKNVPVIIKSFDVELPSDVNYISTTTGIVQDSALTAGSSFGIGNILNQLVQTGSRNAKEAGGLLSSLVSANAGGSVVSAMSSPTAKTSYVPTKSNITIIVQPIYSRDAVRQFSLSKFVSGGYTNGTGGYI